MTISMNDKEVSIEAKELNAEGSIDNGQKATSQDEAFPITLSPNNQNHFTFNDLVSNLEVYINSRIKESDPAVTNQTIGIVISDIEIARQVIHRMNHQYKFGEPSLSAVFFGKCTIPTVFLSDEYVGKSDVDAPAGTVVSLIPFAHYMELRNERIPNTNNALHPHMAPNFFMVVNTSNGYHLAKFIGFEEAFQKASLFSAHLSKTAMQPTGNAGGGLLASYAPLPSLGDTSDQRPVGSGLWNGNNF